MLAGKVRYRLREDPDKRFTQKAFVKSLFAELPTQENDENKLHISDIYQRLVEDEKRKKASKTLFILLRSRDVCGFIWG